MSDPAPRADGVLSSIRRLVVEEDDNPKAAAPGRLVLTEAFRVADAPDPSCDATGAQTPQADTLNDAQTRQTLGALVQREMARALQPDADAGADAADGAADAILRPEADDSQATGGATPAAPHDADHEALRAMVAELVRAELQGALGERITRNVRKLVRREIHRVMLSRDPD